MLVGLAIATIVVGLAYSVISLFGRNIQLIQTNYSNNTSIQLLEQQLAVDLERYRNTIINQASNEASFKTAMDSILYYLDGNIILRGQDTVFNSNYTVFYYLNGELIADGYFDAIKIVYGERQDNKYTFLSKKNDAAMLINIENGTKNF